MEDKQLRAILVLLVPQIITEIVSNDSVSTDTAIVEFYNSKLYECLEREDTKLWHLSPKALYELYHQEKTNGEMIFPEEA